MTNFIRRWGSHSINTLFRSHSRADLLSSVRLLLLQPGYARSVVAYRERPNSTSSAQPPQLLASCKPAARCSILLDRYDERQPLPIGTPTAMHPAPVLELKAAQLLQVRPALASTLSVARSQPHDAKWRPVLPRLLKVSLGLL